MTRELEQLINRLCNSSLKNIFHTDNLSVLAACGKRMCRFIKVVKVLLPYVTTHLCETAFSAVAVMKMLIVVNNTRKGATSCNFINNIAIW
jgi:hypothetical protein